MTRKACGRKVLAWTAGSVLTVGLIMLALSLDDLAPPAPAAPLQNVAFDDGGVLEVIGVSVGERVVEVNPTKRFSIPFFSSKGSSGGIWGGLNVDTEELDGQVVRARLRSEDAPQALLMELRLLESNGIAMRLPNHLARNEMVWQDDRLVFTKSPGGHFTPQDDKVETLRDAMTRAGLQVLVQHRDPRSGWVHLLGPSMFHDGWPDRYVVRLPAWDRSLPTLDFRAIRADGQVAEFSLPNPDLHKSPAMAATAALPIVHTAGDYMLTVRKLRRFAMPGDHPFAAVETELVYKGPPVPGLKNGPISFLPLEAADEWGNVVKTGFESIGRQGHEGAILPAAAKRMTFKVQVVRTTNYPLLASDGYTVLEGVVNAAGSAVDFKPGPDAALFGVINMPVGRITTAGLAWYGDETKGWKELEFDLAGENGSSELDTIQHRIGKLSRWQFVFFTGESAESEGLSSRGGNGGSGWGAGRFHFKQRLSHIFPPELVKPGAKVRVGVHEPMKNDDLSFELELPAAIEPND